MFRCDPKSDAERECFKYLVQFVRSLSDGDLEKFLRFLTGSDTIVVDCIDVEFVGTPASASRRPIAHLCAPMVEVPHTYNSYLELRQEFISILSNIDPLNVDIMQRFFCCYVVKPY